MTDLHELLAAIDPAYLDYSEWVAVGMAIKHEGGTVADWDQWSARDSRPGKYHPGVCEKKWAGFHGSGAPVTAGTLFELAQRHGWRPARNFDSAAYDWDTVVEKPKEASLQFIDTAWVEPVDLEKPTDAGWRPAQELSLYLSTLFEAHDYVGYVTECWKAEDGRSLPTKGVYTRTAGELLQELSRCGDDIGAVIGDYDVGTGAWIRFNPLDGKGVKDENVTAYRYALVESDTVEIEKQAAIYAALELPVAALVHSGGKSLHAIVRVGATSKEDYRERVNYLHKVCKQNGLDIDTQNKNPSRLSRMPGIVRNGQKQYLVGINQGKESWETWREFVEEANDQLPDFESLANVWADLPPLADPLIDGLLRKGHKMLLSGPSKAGKSFLLLELTLAIAEGREWIGWPCAQGRVLYVNLELDRPSCLHRIKDLYTALGWEPRNIGNIDIWNLRGKAVPMDALAPKLIRRAAKAGYVAIIIDPIYKVITGDENAADKMAFFCNQFDRVCSELGAAVIYCHHHSKGAQGQKSARDRSSGSGVFARDPDAILDIIELNVTKQCREALTNSLTAARVGAALDAAVGANWRDDIGQDDILVAARVMEKANELLGPGSDIESIAWDVHLAAQKSTGWRLEGTLREFAPMPPKLFWFRHPIHCTEGADFLTDAKADGEEPPWKAETAARKAETEDGAKRIETAFQSLAFEDGTAMLGDLLESCALTERQVKAWLKKTKKLVLCSDNAIRTKDDADTFEVVQAIEKVGAQGEPASLRDVAKLLKTSDRNLRRWAEKVTAYTIENGKFMPVEASHD